MPALSTAPTARRPAPRAPAPRPSLRVVRAPRHTRRYVGILIAVGAAGVFGVVALNALAAEQAFAARALEREVAQLEVQYDELTAEVAALEAPARVRQVAVDELGMVPAERPAFLFVERPLPQDGIVAHPLAAPAGFADGAVADPVKAALGARR